ncbi:CPBP family intramembrane glutamic endopeptidase [Bacteroides caecigallinarum]|uniref:CPBP family intramembrane glutamic endopeptidase n=1 Tax=Bacteroides caecigallinarum TaxID=1411144 RepID=UPI001F204432|nr:CPBP family intramembrane glutamic endopeptidase [Bacteroides caecigallinarum]MCF2550998.1 CPBP family intramembrane metalloprotease [Bacteroides caecigallinarum]
MGRTIKLLLLYFAYQLAFFGVLVGVYMLKNGVMEMPDVSGSEYMSVIMWAQFLSTLSIGLHVILGKYVSVDVFKLKIPNKWSILIASAVFIVVMGLWTNYFSELAGLPDNMKDVFEQMMNNPLGIISIVVMAPLVEELLFRGAIQGYLMRKWNMPYLGIVISSLIFGVVHGNPAQIPFAFVVGMALGWMYYLTGSLIPGILMHFINNGSSVLLYALSGDPDATMISSLGENEALALAVSGIVLTVVCIFIIRKKIVKEPVQWNEENNLQA